MQIKQWEDKNLAQFSYGILSEDEKKIVLVDPSRNPQPYLDFARKKGAEIVAIIETHPHADFISGHLELRQLTGATIYIHSLAGAGYPHQPFDEGQSIGIGKVRLTSIYTPGHSADSISVLLEYNGKQKAVFTGDTLFIGDCGRPDLREGAGNIHSKREDLARQMYHSLREKLMNLDDDVLVYPAHGAGTLCGKNLSEDSSSTIKREKKTNWSLQEATEEEFVRNLLTDQPFIPAYFPYDVELNRKGAPGLVSSLAAIKSGIITDKKAPETVDPGLWVVDTRDKKMFRQGHLPHSMNIMEDGKFETWLGTIIKPGEPFYLAVESKDQLNRILERVAAIGYEPQVKEAFVLAGGTVKDEALDMQAFKNDPKEYTILDVRTASELRQGKPFSHSMNIPLEVLRARLGEIPTDKPVVVHCAGGYRSAVASSIVKSELRGKARVFDLGESVKKFRQDLIAH